MAALDDLSVFWPLYVIFALVIALGAQVKRVFELRQQMSQYLISMGEEMNELMAEHEKELELEKKKCSTHYLKMLSFRRDCASKVGGLERKLRERNETVKALSRKVESMEWAEEDANEMTDELIGARDEMRRKEELIELLKEQLATCHRNHVELEDKYQRRLRYLEEQLLVSDQENKENQWK